MPSTRPFSTDLNDDPRSPRRLRVRATAPGESESAWLDAIISFDPARATPLKLDRDSAVWRAVIAGREVVLKRRRLVGLVDRFKHAFRASRGWRHWRGAEWLAANGFPTARPLALLSERRDGPDPGWHEWLALEHLPGRTVLEHLRHADLSAREQHALARVLATRISDMVALGRFNRDHKPSNLIVTSWRPGSSGDEPTVAVIDCVAIHRCRRFDFSKMKRMLASLMIEPIGTACPPRTTLRMRALVSIDAAVWWSELDAMVRAHGDPVPKIDPFARSDAGSP
jgi:hypothetical protein